MKIPILRGDFALSVRGVFSFPTGDSHEFLSTGYWTAYPAVVMAGTLGQVTIGGEVGYRLRTRSYLAGLEQDDELQAQLGVNVALTDVFSLIAEGQLRAGIGGRTLESNEVPIDANLGLRITPTAGLAIDVGAGTGLAAGYGSPAGRGFVIVRYATATEGCEFGPEDFDGFEDGDYCADPTTTRDGIEDADDDCPNDPEDVDGFRDTDGCPDPDNDADGVPDADGPLPAADRGHRRRPGSGRVPGRRQRPGRDPRRRSTSAGAIPRIAISSRTRTAAQSRARSPRPSPSPTRAS